MKKFIVWKRALSLLLLAAVTILVLGPSASAQDQAGTSVTAAAPVSTQAALGSSIPYQGQLQDNGTAANGAYDFQFKLFDNASAGSQIGGELNKEDVTVANGLFAVELDFGSGVFNGEARYLEFGVRPGANTGAYTILSPRRPLLAVPYALYSLASAGGSGGNPAYGAAAGAPQDSVHVAANGNVGIGNISSTDARLSVVQNGDWQLRLENPAIGGGFWNIGQSSDNWNAGGGKLLFTPNSDNSNLAAVAMTTDGKVGIGTTAPQAPLDIRDGPAWRQGWHKVLRLDQAGAIEFVSTVTSYGVGVANNGTLVFFAADGNVNGSPTGEMTLSKEGNLTVSGTTTTKVLRITGGDLAEPFAIANAEAIQPGMVVAIDPDNPGELRLSTSAYARTVAGVVSGAGGIDTGVLMYEGADGENTHPVALSGRVYVYADATNGPIAPGDLLTTANIPGHAMKVTDYARAQGAILGKAMSRLDEGTGLVLILVTLQ